MRDTKCDEIVVECSPEGFWTARVVGSNPEIAGFGWSQSDALQDAREQAAARADEVELVLREDTHRRIRNVERGSLFEPIA
jgi:hypothetical protein